MGGIIEACRRGRAKTSGAPCTRVWEIAKVAPTLRRPCNRLHDGSPMTETKSETRDGMCIDWDAAIPMDDGVVLRADVFRPTRDGKYPVILSYGPYAKGLAFQ